MSTLLDASNILYNPDFMLYRVDIDRAELHFLEVTEDTYRRSTYLDNRIQHTKERLISLPIDEIIKAFEQMPERNGSIQFLFHISFCCSTLLTRALQLPGRTLVLREPWVLFQMSSIKTRMLSTGEWNTQGPALTDLMLSLLNKTYAPDEHIVVKPTNLANNLIEDLLTTLPDSRGILLYTSLREFIISNLKKPDETKQRIPWLASEAAALVDYRDSFPDIIPAQLPHLHAAVVFWHAQLLHFLRLLANWPERLRTLQSGVLLEEPASVLRSTSNWLKLQLPEDHINTVIHGDIWRSHAKDPRYKYGVKFREQENMEIIDRHSAAIEDALTWAAPLLASRPVSAIEDYALQPSSAAQNVTANESEKHEH
ncbi:MAG: hypothetical protein ACRESI_03205 [Gammaproteobacteria bacterium]